MPVSIREAAERLGMSAPGVYEMIRHGRLVASGRPALVDDNSVRAVAAARRIDALDRVGDETDFARRVVDILHPESVIITRASGAVDPDSVIDSMRTPRGTSALHQVPADAWALWGPTVLRGAAARADWTTSRGCLTCWTRLSARVHATMGPRADAPTRILLGQGCDTCQTALAAEAADTRQAMNRLHLQVKGRAAADRRDRLTRAADTALAELQEASRRHTAAVQAARAAGVPGRRARDGRR